MWPENTYKWYFCQACSNQSLILAMALCSSVYREFIYCISSEGCTFYLSFVDKVRSRKYVKNFFSGAPHWPPAALPGDSCHLHCLTFANSRLGCTSVQKRVIRPAPRGSAEPIWLPGGEYGVPGAPGGCAQQGHESQAEAGHCTEWGQALGVVARSCQGFQSSSGGAGRGFV